MDVDFEQARKGVAMEQDVEGDFLRVVFAYGGYKACGEAEPLGYGCAEGHAFDAHAQAEHQEEGEGGVGHVGHKSNPHRYAGILATEEPAVEHVCAEDGGSAGDGDVEVSLCLRSNFTFDMEES